jgi:hypothetical protein
MEPTNAIMDKSLRSVFVGNIPYEATEEKLKDIFCQAGSVGMYDWEGPCTFVKTIHPF